MTAPDRPLVDGARIGTLARSVVENLMRRPTSQVLGKGHVTHEEIETVAAYILIAIKEAGEAAAKLCEEAGTFECSADGETFIEYDDSLIRIAAAIRQLLPAKGCQALQR